MALFNREASLELIEGESLFEQIDEIQLQAPTQALDAQKTEDPTHMVIDIE